MDAALEDPALLSLEEVSGPRPAGALRRGEPAARPPVDSPWPCSTEVGGGRHLRLRVKFQGQTMDAIFSATAEGCGIAVGGAGGSGLPPPGQRVPGLPIRPAPGGGPVSRPERAGPVEQIPPGEDSRPTRPTPSPPAGPSFCRAVALPQNAAAPGSGWRRTPPSGQKSGPIHRARGDLPPHHDLAWRCFTSGACSTWSGRPTACALISSRWTGRWTWRSHIF